MAFRWNGDRFHVGFWCLTAASMEECVRQGRLRDEIALKGDIHPLCGGEPWKPMSLHGPLCPFAQPGSLPPCQKLHVINKLSKWSWVQCKRQYHNWKAGSGKAMSALSWDSLLQEWDETSPFNYQPCLTHHNNDSQIVVHAPPSNNYRESI